MKAVSKKQIEDWKAEHGRIYQLDTEDGKSCIIRDPLSDLGVMKMAVAELSKSRILYMQCLIHQCWLEGDEVIKTDEKYINGFEDLIDEITESPKYTLSPNDNGFAITIEDRTIQVRKALRTDILKAEKKNTKDEPWMTVIYLLQMIADDKSLEIAKEDTRSYIGFLLATEDVKNKVTSVVKKL